MSAGTKPSVWPTRRAFAAAAAGTTALGIGLGGCWPFQSTLYQNFRITVEDELGTVLGSGVWQYGENVPGMHLSHWAGTDGEAFPIVHRSMGRMYVSRSQNSGWGGGWAMAAVREYQKAGLALKNDSQGFGADGFRDMAKIKTRVEIPLRDTPLVVRFADDRNRYSLQVVTTYSNMGRPPDVVLRFFVAPTNERITSGNIVKLLPWLPEAAGGFVVGRGSGQDRDYDKTPGNVYAESFFTRRAHDKAAAANRAKKL